LAEVQLSRSDTGGGPIFVSTGGPIFIVTARLNAAFRKKSKETLVKVLEDASNTELGSFAASLRRDLNRRAGGP
jgi:hypothetical protein